MRHVIVKQQRHARAGADAAARLRMPSSHPERLLYLAGGLAAREADVGEQAVGEARERLALARPRATGCDPSPEAGGDPRRCGRRGCAGMLPLEKWVGGVGPVGRIIAFPRRVLICTGLARAGL